MSKSLIIDKEVETEEEKFKELSKQFILKQDEVLTTVVSKVFISYAIIEEFYKFCNMAETKTSFLLSPRSYSSFTIKGELISQQIKFQEVKDFVYSTIPFAPLTFPKEYNCPHGPNYKNIYIFFFSDQIPTLDFMVKTIQRFNKLKAFL